MKKFLLLISLVFLTGCEKNFDSIIDLSQSNYQVTSVSSFPSFTYIPGDSLISLRVVFRSSEDVKSAYGNIYSSENIMLNSNPINLFDNGRSENGDASAGDNIYSNRFPLSQYYPVGNYKIEYFVIDKFDKTKLIAVHNFTYDNGQSNIAPEISNLVMSDVIQAGETILFSVEVADSNGLNDIDFVFYETYNPDGVKVVNSQGISQFPMFDDGNTQENGDVNGNDGKYTVILTFPSTAQKGTWRFEFQARDRGKKLSDKIIHNIVVQ